MILKFTKYHGTGNDFIMVDCTENSLNFQEVIHNIPALCERRFGIGADGLIMLFKHKEYDFEMQYYNSDGTRSFCGNGARCAVKFAFSLGLFTKTCTFLAIDGVHSAFLNDDGLVELKMQDVKEIKTQENAFIIDTGSPHYIEFREDLAKENIVEFGKKIRYSPIYKDNGINVNLVEEIGENKLKMLTYERGVEGETYSCGTGATAVGLAYADSHHISDFRINIEVKGGNLKIKGKKDKNGYHSIYLIGSAEKVYEGNIEI